MKNVVNCCALLLLLAAVGCSSSDTSGPSGGSGASGGGGTAGQAGASGTGGAAGNGGASGTGGASGASGASGGGGVGGTGGGVDDADAGDAGGAAGGGGASGSGGAGNAYCDNDYSGGCFCVGDPNHIHAPGEGLQECSETSVGDAICCQDPDYPGSVTSCTCKRWGCWESGATCNCGYGDATSNPQASCQKAWAYCCEDNLGDQCSCSNFPCGVVLPNQVTSCAPTCAPQKIPTTKCL